MLHKPSQPWLQILIKCLPNKWANIFRGDEPCFLIKPQTRPLTAVTLSQLVLSTITVVILTSKLRVSDIFGFTRYTL